MEFTAKQIASFIEGRIEGDENAKITTFAKIEEGVPGAISFLSNPKYTHYIYNTKSSVILINEDVELTQPVNATLIRVKNAYECVAKLLQALPIVHSQENRHKPDGFHIRKRQNRERLLHWRVRVYRATTLK